MPMAPQDCPQAAAGIALGLPNVGEAEEGVQLVVRG